MKTYSVTNTEARQADQSAAIRKILVPTDFSAGAEKSFDYALMLGRATGAEIHLLHILDQVEGDFYSPLRYIPELLGNRKSPDDMAYARLLSAMFRHDTIGVKVYPVKRRGRAVVPAIVDYVKQEKIDLIVMSGSRHSIPAFLSGSTADQLVRKTSCPVLTVEAEAPTIPSKIERRGSLANV